ncbi:phage tail length tape measure family protein [Novosphingobium humi]|uniref:Phage tail length tape measure family protein n=1 Tax=Novosphingobium humi TaxID=2282397 RepID=A0ABY7U022_9SPHN|nr:phage tail length tape measure family protein [Novosphingobium humi]WCT78874.1 phage tail length tape measure family protein [Novosphingobium humi]
MAVKPLVLVVSGQTDKLKTALRSGAADLTDFSKTTEELLEGIQQKVRDSLGITGEDAGAQLGRNLSQQVQAWNRAAQNATATGVDFDPLGGMTSAKTLEAAAAQERLAATYREQAAGAAAAQGANERETLTLRQVAVASELAAAKADQEAAALRTQAGVLEAMERAMGRHNAAQRQTAEVSGATRNAMRDLSFQVSDVATSLAGGMPPMMVFSQQFGQIIGAFQMMGGEGNKLISFLSGPWGMALSTAAVAIVPLLGNLEIFNDKVGDAAKKLKEQAESTRIADQAQAIFDRTLDGAIARERKLADELDRQLKTRRQLNQEKLNEAKESQGNLANQVESARRELRSALAEQKAANDLPANGEAGRAARDSAVQNADRKVEEARTKLFDAQQAELNAQADVRRAEAIQIQARAKEGASPQSAQQARFDRERERLQGDYVRGSISKEEYDAQLSALEKSAEAAKEKPKKKKDTSAREAEAEMKSGAAYDDAIARTVTDLANLARQNVTDLEELGRLDKAAVDAARDRERAATEEQGRREKWSRAQIDALQYKQGEVAEAKKAQIDERIKREVADRWIETQRAALTLETQMLQAQSALALTTAERRALALQILENERKQAILAVDKKVTDGQLTGEQGMAEIGKVNQTYDLKTEQTKKQYASPVEQWRNDLKKNTADINASLQSVEVTGLKGLEDGFVGIISGTQSAAQAFKSMAASIIADLARIAIQQAFVKVFGGGLSSGGKVPGRAQGSLLGFAAGGLPGYAGGVRLSNGMISGPGTGTSDSILALVDGQRPIAVSNDEGIVNARAVRNYWPMIDAMNKGTFPKFADGGLLSAASLTGLAYPRIPSAASLSTRAVIISAPQYHMPGAITTAELMQWTIETSARHAQAAAAAAPIETRRQLARRDEQRIT